jgi:hypothetical protein
MGGLGFNVDTGEFEFGEQGASGGSIQISRDQRTVNTPNGRQATASRGFPLSILVHPCKALGTGVERAFPFSR